MKSHKKNNAMMSFFFFFLCFILSQTNNQFEFFSFSFKLIDWKFWSFFGYKTYPKDDPLLVLKSGPNISVLTFLTFHDRYWTFYGRF